MLNPAGSLGDIINIKEAKKLIRRLEGYYLTWLRFVTKTCESQYSAKVPILIHGYGYAVPNNRPIWGVWHSWLYPHFRKKGHTDLQRNTDAIARLVDRFNDMLSNLHTKKHLSHVKYIDLRDCLSNNLRCLNDREGHNYGDTDDCLGEFELDWNDELHPTSDGFEKLAKKFSKKIKKLS